MKEIKFNYCLPREYKNSKTGEINHSLCAENEKMNVASIDDVQKLVTDDMSKSACPWMQVFANGYRVGRKSVDWKDWNGVTFSDIDSKHYYNNVKKFNVKACLQLIDNNARAKYPENYYCSYITFSGTGFRILWYWDCERTEENFQKCSMLTERYTREVFYSMGPSGKAIIDYDEFGKKTLDTCSKSVLQGLYVTKNEIKYNDKENGVSGACDISNVKLEEVLEVTNVLPNVNGFDQHQACVFNGKKTVKKEDLPYYPHAKRWCIYEALVRLFKDHKKVEEEWRYICTLLPEGDGHDEEFYVWEPSKNKWYARYNNNTIHSLHWLIPFGYDVTDKSEYIYINQFTRSWQHHVKKEIFNILIETSKYKAEMEKHVNDHCTSKNEKEREEWRKDYKEILWKKIKNKEVDILSTSILDDCEEDQRDKVVDLQKSLFKRRWEPYEFKYLVMGYEIPTDIVTYKMYADFYYRDENGLPTIRYDVREDELENYGYWYETKKIQWHTFKFGDEHTHWKNSSTFCNKSSKTDLIDAVSKYARRWHTRNSVTEYFDNLDLSIANEEMLETWAIRYFKCDDTPLTRFISKTFFIAAVKKQFIEDPTTFAYPHILFIQGPTGCGKSYFLKNMFTFGGKELILNKIDPKDPDNIIGPLVAKNMLIQFGEGATLKKTDANTQKEFVDRLNMSMKYQRKYENEQTTVYPRVVICRTSNEDVLFNDVSINEGDRRNLLLVCKCEPMCCDEKMRQQMQEEKDMLWATAYKLYLDDPDADLEMSQEMFRELGKMQDEFKLIKENDIDEIYSEVFDRKYYTNDKGCILDEVAFKKMVERAEEAMDSATANLFLGDNYNKKMYISRIPAKWVSNYVKEKYGIGTMKLLKDRLFDLGWTFKQSRYNDNNTFKCWIKDRMKPDTVNGDISGGDDQKPDSDLPF